MFQDGDVFIGYEDEASNLLKKLASITKKKLEVISIVGMAGLDVLIVWDATKLIRALDISSIELFVFPSELLELVHLRYLELRFRSGNPPESISNLRELQTLVMSSRTNMVVPENIWKMINLRHLSIKSGENLVHLSNVEEEPILLENMLAMSLLNPTRPCQIILASSRNLQKLGLCGPLTTKSGELKIPDLSLLIKLEKLKLLNTVPLSKATRAWKLYENDMHSNLIDQTLDPSEYEVESVKKVIEIALKCTQSPVSIRPTMSEVVVLLVNEGSVDQKPPSKPIVIDGVSTSTTPSISSATFTSMESGGRQQILMPTMAEVAVMLVNEGSIEQETPNKLKDTVHLYLFSYLTCLAPPVMNHRRDIKYWVVKCPFKPKT
ncbi:hypothetical protein POM88_043607 [Heracleum sosnowskyi]|uniref:Uncharacterized protein n=1 Tax=Heracleum sosnowskyi TaxID=360622 RepID=A0AAD8M4M1_9APIA|nr:hypothetical protein POM88_043607 [Heracleum sosnowskyi]